MLYLIDTNTWIRFLRKERAVCEHLEIALTNRDRILVSPIVYFELLRGLEKRQDTQSIKFIKGLWSDLDYVEMSRAIWDRAIELWVVSVKMNQVREDADTLIAATASVLDACVVTTNEKHFGFFGVPIANWAA